MELKKEQDKVMAELNKPENVNNTSKPFFSIRKDTPVSDINKIGGKDMLPKKIAALELYKLHGKTKIISIISLGGLVISLLFFAFNTMVGAGVAVILTAILGMFIVNSQKEMLRLKKEYNLD
jgi:hypothetical protein